MTTSTLDHPAAPPECFKSKAPGEAGKAADYLQLRAIAALLPARVAGQKLYI
jgi:hypothetical protein